MTKSLNLFLQRTALVASTLVFLILILAETSRADTVYNLTNTNVPGITADITVTVSDGCTGAGNCTVSVNYISSDITNTVKEISPIGMITGTFNVALTSSNPSGWTGGACPTNGGNPGCGGYDGFGKFKSEANSNAAQSEDFVLTLADTTFSPNSTGANFAVHVQFFGVNGDTVSLVLGHNGFHSKPSMICLTAAGLARIHNLKGFLQPLYVSIGESKDEAQRNCIKPLLLRAMKQVGE